MISTRTKIRFTTFAGLMILTLAFLGITKLTGAPNTGSDASNATQANAGQALSQTPPYSFSKDADNDGLSNAKEYIYGTDPTNPDTDDDGYKDGAEVENAYDPLVPGNAKLADRPNLSLTIRYFSWAKAKTGNKDPQLDETLLKQFLTSQKLTTFTLSAPPATDITATDAGGLSTYLSKIAAISLPGESQDYNTLATNAFQNGNDSAALKVAEDIRGVYRQFAAIPTPPQALTVQKQFLGALKALESMFRDLGNAQKDPVRVVLDEEKGAWLKGQLTNIEQARQNLAHSLNQ